MIRRHGHYILTPRGLTMDPQVTVSHGDGQSTVTVPHPVLHQLWTVLGPILVKVALGFLTGLAQPQTPPAPPQS